MSTEPKITYIHLTETYILMKQKEDEMIVWPEGDSDNSCSTYSNQIICLWLDQARFYIFKSHATKSK